MGRRATTLLELLVVLSIFSLLLIAVLSFYVYASRVSRSQDRMSTSYRKALKALERIDHLTFGSAVVRCTPHQVIFSRLDRSRPVGHGRVPNFVSEPESFALLVHSDQSSTLVHRRHGRTETIAQFEPGEEVTFSAGLGFQVTVKVRLKAIDGVGRERSYELTRTHSWEQL